jgi:hypothetical protein
MPKRTDAADAALASSSVAERHTITLTLKSRSCRLPRLAVSEIRERPWMKKLKVDVETIEWGYGDSSAC